MNSKSLIYVAGHNGLVGSAIVRELENKGYKNIIVRDKKALNLLNADAVDAFFATAKPEYVFLAAAKVGGILANDTYPADFIYENIVIQTNIIKSSYNHKVDKLLFLGSSCIYPKECAQPISEDYLLTGPLEKTNEAYAIAKIAGIKMCQSFNKQYGTNYISVMPTNLYGPNDNFDLSSSHVLPALIRKFHDAKLSGAKEVVMWGTGTPKREFLHVDDLASACLFLMEQYNESNIVNIGTGEDISIRELAETISGVVGFKGEIVNDTSKPDGTPKKLLNVDYLHSLGWTHGTNLKDGITKTYAWYLESLKK